MSFLCFARSLVRHCSLTEMWVAFLLFTLSAVQRYTSNTFTFCQSRDFTNKFLAKYDSFWVVPKQPSILLSSSFLLHQSSTHFLYNVGLKLLSSPSIWILSAWNWNFIGAVAFFIITIRRDKAAFLLRLRRLCDFCYWITASSYVKKGWVSYDSLILMYLNNRFLSSFFFKWRKKREC